MYATVSDIPKDLLRDEARNTNLDSIIGALDAG